MSREREAAGGAHHEPGDGRDEQERRLVRCRRRRPRPAPSHTRRTLPVGRGRARSRRPASAAATGASPACAAPKRRACWPRPAPRASWPRWATAPASDGLALAHRPHAAQARRARARRSSSCAARRRSSASPRVCVNPNWVSLCRELLRNSGVKVCTVIGFPLGAHLPDIKAYETKRAIEQGAEEVDMVINIGALKSRDYALVEQDIHGVVQPRAGRPRHRGQGDPRDRAAHATTRRSWAARWPRPRAPTS